MHDDGSKTRRSVVPRWRSLARTPDAELRSITRSKSNREQDTLSLKKKSELWQKTRSLIHASDLVDAAVHFGERQVGQDAANQIIASGAATSSVVQSASKYLTAGIISPLATEISEHDRWRSIAALKMRLVIQPRDAITAVELSRLYTLNGQPKKAAISMERAIKIAPNDRYILRSACRLFTHLNDHERALDIVCASEAVRSDPWVQSAEVAVADQMGRTPKWGTKSLKNLVVSAKLGTNFSELAVGLASLEQKNGAKRRTVRSLIEHSLFKPTENALAQAIWMDERDDYSLHTELLADEISLANEARALTAHDSGNYEKAIVHAFRWAADQPFSKRPYLLGASCATLYLDDANVAEEFSRKGLRIYPSDPQLSNGLLVALAYQNRLEEAEQLLPALATVRTDPERGAFYHAALGLLAYRRGRLEDGRTHYRDAIEAAKKSRDRSLSFHAAMFWIEQEAYSGAIPLEDWSDLKQEVDHQFNTIKDYSGRELRRTWAARKAKLDALVHQPMLDSNSSGIPGYSLDKSLAPLLS